MEDAVEYEEEKDPIPSNREQTGPTEQTRARRRRSIGGPKRWVSSLLHGVSKVSFGTVRIDLARQESYDAHTLQYGLKPLSQTHLKIYRRIAFDPYIFNRRPVVDFAAGISVGTQDGNMIQPKCRLRIGPHIRVKMFPEPAFQYKQRFKPTPNSRVAVETTCVVPFESLRRPEPGEMHKGAYLGVKLRNDVSTGIHLTIRGVEFDEKLDIFGPYGTVRAAVQIDFPTEFPMKENQDPVQMRINRLSMTIPTP